MRGIVSGFTNKRQEREKSRGALKKIVQYMLHTRGPAILVAYWIPNRKQGITGSLIIGETPKLIEPVRCLSSFVPKIIENNSGTFVCLDPEGFRCSEKIKKWYSLQHQPPSSAYGFLFLRLRMQAPLCRETMARTIYRNRVFCPVLLLFEHIVLRYLLVFDVLNKAHV